MSVGCSGEGIERQRGSLTVLKAVRGRISPWVCFAGETSCFKTGLEFFHGICQAFREIFHVRVIPFSVFSISLLATAGPFVAAVLLVRNGRLAVAERLYEVCSTDICRHCSRTTNAID